MFGNPFTDPDWSRNIAGTLEHWVGRLRSVTTDNAVKASRAVVFGVLVVIALSTAIPLALILLMRLTQTAVSRVARTDHDTTVWITYFVLAVIFVGLGFVALRRRHRQPAER
ncbi:MAG: hypothetical protein RJB61_130 [Actinomycetota bacterium]